MIYVAYLEKGEDSGYLAHCPAIPGCHSQGETMESAIENIRDAIRGCVEALGEELAAPRRDTLKVEIEV